MHVLLVNPNRIQPPVAPLAMDSLGESLLSRGIGVSLIDLCVDGPTDQPLDAAFLRSRTDREPDIVLMTVRNLDDAYYFSQVSFLPALRETVACLRAAFGKPVIVGGSGFSIAPAPLLHALDADFGVAGASEPDLLGLLEHLDEPAAAPGLPGVVWKDGDRVTATPPSPPAMVEDFFTPRRIVANRLYHERGGMVGLETKRGCSSGCRYCVDPVAKGHRVHRKPLPWLLGEIRSLVAQGAPIFHLCDSEFNVPHDHALDVCRAIREAGLAERIRWFTYATPLGFDSDLATAMREAGCAGINFGIDHCDEGILERLGRRHRLEDIERTVGAAREAGLSVFFDLLLGSPGETRETLRRTLECCRDLDVPRVGANVGVRVYPGTPLAAEVLASGPLPDNPNLAGRRENNDQLLDPVFYVSAELGPDWQGYLASLVEEDARFFLPIRRAKNASYNYNENAVLVDALREGHRGAFWDILRRVQEGLPPLRPPAAPAGGP